MTSKNYNLKNYLINKFTFPAKKIKARNGLKLKRNLILKRSDKNIKKAENRCDCLLRYYPQAEIRRGRNYIGVYRSVRKKKGIVGVQAEEVAIITSIEEVQDQIESLNIFVRETIIKDIESINKNWGNEIVFNIQKLKKTKKNLKNKVLNLETKIGRQYLEKTTSQRALMSLVRETDFLIDKLINKVKIQILSDLKNKNLSQFEKNAIKKELEGL